MELLRFYSAKDLRELAKTAGHPVHLPSDFQLSHELLRSMQHEHWPMRQVQGVFVLFVLCWGPCWQMWSATCSLHGSHLMPKQSANAKSFFHDCWLALSGGAQLQDQATRVHAAAACWCCVCLYLCVCVCAGEFKLSKVRKAPAGARSRAQSPFFWRYSVDASTFQLLTDRPVTDFLVQ